MPFEFIQTNIPDVILIKPRIFRDDRGFFMETYKYSEFAANGIEEHFVQDNQSRSTYGVLRGLHYQLTPKAQGKLVRCLSGKILDVAVDIRQGSPTFGQWVSQELSEENKYMFYVPVGFAHGFSVLSETCEVHYKTTDEYSPEHERSIIWNDSDLNINWQVTTPELADKDKQAPAFKHAEFNFFYG